MCDNPIPIMNFLSLWIVIYSYIYILNIMPYNPLILLYIAIGFYIINFFNILSKVDDYNNSSIIYYNIVNLLMKIPPYLIIINMKNNNITIIDVIFSIIFIIIYTIYMNMLKIDIYELYKSCTDFIIDRNKGIPDEFYCYISKKFHNYF